MNTTLSKTYIATLTGSAAVTAALVGIYLNVAWYVGLPVAVVAGLLVGLVAATVVDSL